MSTYRNVSLWAIKIGLFIVPFIPLYVSRALFFPFITGKAFAFRMIVEVIFALWIALAIFYKEFRPRKSLLLYALLAFIIIVMLAGVFGVNPSRSFWSNFERMEGILAHLHLFAFFLVAAHVFNKKEWFVYFNFFVVAGFGQNIVALLQKVGVIASPQGGIRTDGTIGNATYVAAYSIFVLGISLLFLLRSKITAARVWYGFMALFTLLTIYFTATRGAILALFLGVVASGVLYVFLQRGTTPRDKKYRKVVIGMLAVVILLTSLVKVFDNSSFVKGNETLSRIASISFAEGKTRFRIWNMAFQGFKERPLLGWGPDNYNAVFGKYYDPGLYAQEPWFDRAHQIFLDWMISAGVLGLLAYIGIFIASLVLLWRWYRSIPQTDGEKQLWLKTAILISVLFFVYFVQNIFVFDQFATYMSFFSILAYIHAVTTEHREEKREAKTMDRASDPFRWTGVAIAAIALFVVIYFINWKPIMANTNLLNALKAGNLSSFDYHQEALTLGPLGRTEIREQLSQFTIAVLASSEVDAPTKKTIFDRTISELKKGEEEAPLDPRAALFTGIVYTEAGFFDEAIAAFERALALSPRKQQIFFQIGDVYIRKNDYPSAKKVLEEAFALEPRFAQARLSLVAAYILNGDQERANELLIEAYGKADVAESVLAQAYARKKDYRRLLGVWRAFLEGNQSNIEYWKNVAAVYLELGEKNNAIKTLEEAIALHSSFKEEGEGYIEEIRAGRN